MASSNLKKIHLVAGARPNFMKIAPLYHALCQTSWAAPVLIHTGQHYDDRLSDTFFRDFALPPPQFYLGAGSGTHAEQTAKVMVAYEKLLQEDRPHLVVVAGDVNSTLAAALAAVKLHIPVAHLEAGLRSYDRRMPEEINRVMTDTLCDLLWTPSPDAGENLRREGIPAHKIECVGNVMMDMLETLRPQILGPQPEADDILGVCGKPYALVTLHRPENVDNEHPLHQLVQGIAETADSMDIIFPVHPRTLKTLEAFNLKNMLAAHSHIHLLPPLGYMSFMKLLHHAGAVITDSGGLQEETTYLNIPCITLRPNTERPVTITHGSNRLGKPETLAADLQSILAGRWPQAQKIPLWDGHTAPRVVKSIGKFLAVSEFPTLTAA